MGKVGDLIAELCPEGVSHQALGDVAEYSKRRVSPGSLSESTYVGVENLLQSGRGRADANSVPAYGSCTEYREGDVLIGNIRPYLKKIWLADRDGGTNGDVLVIRIKEHYRERVLPEFLFYVLASDSFFLFDMKHAKGAKMPRGDKAAVMKYLVPLPPKAVQAGIIDALDLLYGSHEDLVSEIDIELKARSQQFAHYHDALLEAGPDESSPLSELVHFENGRAHERLVAEDGTVALLTARYLSTGGSQVRRVRSGNVLTPARVGDVALVMSDLPNGRALARSFYVEQDGKYAANQRVCLLRPKDPAALSGRYLFHFLNRNPQLLAYNNGQDQTHLSKGQILGVKVPRLTLLEQERISDILDRYAALAEKLESALVWERDARRQQYAFYHEELLTFKELHS